MCLLTAAVEIVQRHRLNASRLGLTMKRERLFWSEFRHEKPAEKRSRTDYTIQLYKTGRTMTRVHVDLLTFKRRGRSNDRRRVPSNTAVTPLLLWSYDWPRNRNVRRDRKDGGGGRKSRTASTVTNRINAENGLFWGGEGRRRRYRFCVVAVVRIFREQF